MATGKAGGPDTSLCADGVCRCHRAKVAEQACGVGASKRAPGAGAGAAARAAGRARGATVGVEAAGTTEGGTGGGGDAEAVRGGRQE